MDILGKCREKGDGHMGPEEKYGYLPFEIPQMTIGIDLFRKSFSNEYAVAKLRRIETGVRETLGVQSVERKPSFVGGYCGHAPHTSGTNVITLKS